MRPVLLAAAAAAALGAACTPRSALYDWDGYDDALYRHYKAPQDREAWVAALKTAVLAAESEGRRVPPGLYAEYGYALLEESRFDESVAYFKKEKETWPESAVIMDKMIRNVARLQGTKTTAPGGTKAAAPAAGGSSK